MRKPLIMGNGKINCEYAENSSVPNINFDLRHTLDFLSINTHQHMHIAAMQIVAIHCWTNLTFSKWVFVYAIFSFELYRYEVIYFSLIFCYRCHSHFKQFFFCNYSEFYYIQMEKYARQAVSEGVKSSDDLHIGGDSEIYRVLNLHYNRNNHIEVSKPHRFLFITFAAQQIETWNAIPFN